MKNATINHDIREKLMERFRRLAGNHDVEELNSLKKDIEKYLENYEDHDDKRMENTLCLIKAWINYKLKDDLKSSYELIVPVLENLKFDNLESNYNKMLLISSITVCKDYSHALELVFRLEESVSTPSIDESIRTQVILHSYLNFAEILLNTKFFIELSSDEEIEVNNLFAEYAEKIRKICFEKDSYEGIHALITLKEGIFHKDRTLQNKAVKMANELEEDEIMKVIEHNLDKYKLMGTIVKVRSFNERFGNRVRQERKRRNLSTNELAKMIGLSNVSINALERGERATTPEKIVYIAQTFGLTVNDLLYDRSELIHGLSLVDKQSEIMMALRVLSEDELDFVLNHIKALIKLNKR
ncbi:MAG: helix-turn-helix domain-containing protein [Defluviitaleaceae bacterium]|nr:helix-turn-helix domain-containing protein [Defluviitaleaceae bacterium]